MTDDKNSDSKPKEALIKNHLRRAFQEKAEEAIPDDLMALVQKLRMQDDHDGSK